MSLPHPSVSLLLLDTVDSTILEAERQASAGRGGPLVICAASQTGGIGRHGRRWSSPPGNLYWTILLDADSDRPRDAGLAFAAGLAVRDMLIELGTAPARLALKWPNDVLLDGRKLAGVLAQSSLGGDRAHTVVGIGINVATCPADAAYPAASFVTAGLPLPALAVLRAALTASFLDRRAQWHRGGLPAMRDPVAACLHGVGQPCQVARNRNRTDILTGINEGLDPIGALLIRTADGVRHAVVAGDVLA